MAVTDNAENLKRMFSELMSTVFQDENEVDDANESAVDFWQPHELKIDGWLGCCAHQLQLVLGDGFTELQGCPRVQNILAKAKGISTFSHRCKNFSYKLSHQIPVPCDTRWNSHMST